MAVTRVGSSTLSPITTASTLTVTATLPTGSAAGDVLIGVGTHERSTEIPAIPAGFTSVRGSSQGSAVSGRHFWKRLNSTDISTGSVTITSAGGRRQKLGLAVYRGCADPVYVTGTSVSNPGTVQTLTGPTATPTVNDSMLVSVMSLSSTAAPLQGRTYSVTAGSYTELADEWTNSTSANAGVHIAERLLSGGAGVSQAAIVLTEASTNDTTAYIPGVFVLAPGTGIIPPEVTPDPTQINLEPGTILTTHVVATDDGTITTYTCTSPGITFTGTGNTRTFLAPLTIDGTTVDVTWVVTDNDGATTTVHQLFVVLGCTIQIPKGGVMVAAVSQIPYLVPSIDITSPAAAATVSNIVDLTATAVGVIAVSFFVSTTLIGIARSDDGAIWICPDVNSAEFPNGAYTLIAKGTTSTGVEVTDSISVTVNNTPVTPPTPPNGAVVVSPANGALVSGNVTLSATVPAPLGATAVVFEVGRPERPTFPATQSGTTWTTAAGAWKSALTADESAAAVNDARYSVRAKITTPTGIVYSNYVYVITRNLIVTGAPTPAWDPAFAWAANYGNGLSAAAAKSAYVSSFASIYGEGAVTIVTDPAGVHGNVARVIMPDNYPRSDQPNTPDTVRFQAQTRSELGEGAMAFFGFAFMPDESFPTMYGYSDPLDPDYPDVNGTGYVQIMQNYGAPFNRGPAFALTERFEYSDDIHDNLRMSGNALNPGDPGNLFNIPIHRTQWTDFVVGVAESTDILTGWMEFYVREPADGPGSPLRQLSLFGLTRLPRVLLQLTSPGNRFDTQLYRRLGEFTSVGAYFAKQKIGPTAASVDPHSY